jgi:acetolactate synthase I/II/III large subunit
MLGANIIAAAIKDMGIKIVYLYPGGTIAPLLDAFVSLGIEYVCARNEQGAGYAAIGAAKMTGKPQLVMVTSGPGATNLVTPVADAYYDSVPIIAITGQVGVSDINIERKVRQTGFQETDSKNIFTPITKKASVIIKFENLYQQITDMVTITTDGRPGPVLIDIPMSIQRGKVENERWARPIISEYNNAVVSTNEIVEEGEVESALKMLESAERPLVLVGNGVYISKATDSLKNVIDKMGVPVVCSLPGVGAFSGNHPLYYGFIGHTGEFYANIAANYADLILVLGARLDLRQTGTELDKFLSNKRIVRVDIDAAELTHGRIDADLKIQGDVDSFLIQLLEKWGGMTPLNISTWIDKIEGWKTKYNSCQFYSHKDLSSYHILRAVDNYTKGKRIMATSGVGTHQQLVARYFTFDYPDRVWMTSAGHGTMGYDVPTMIGAMLERSDYDYGLVFVGDGSFQMNIQELATIKNFNLPIKIFVLDNQRLGLVSQFQLMNWPTDYSTGRKINPSFSSIAIAYGLKGYDINNNDDLAEKLDDILDDSSGCVVHCHIDSNEDVLPILLAGQKMNEMFPFDGEA